MKTKISDHTIKHVHGMKYYTGAHPKMRTYLRSKLKPREFGNKVWATSLALLEHFQSNSYDF